jgi:hypothetical protein
VTASVNQEVEFDGDPVDAAPARRYRPWWVWLSPFALITGLLVAVNWSFLGSPVYEIADEGANSILVEQARRFHLLIGNYSRTHINHPGPAFMYVRAAGEQAFWAATRWVPSAFTGQMIGVYVLDAVCAACVIAICYGWFQQVRGALVALAVIFVFAYLHPPIFSSDWMPYAYVLPYFTFLVAIASVAAGRLQDTWIMVGAGWFLIQGHVCFLLFVPVLFAVAVIGLAWPRRRRLGAAARSFFVNHRRTWIPAVAISAVFLLPMVANVILHYPGDWGKYLSVSGSDTKGHPRTLGQVLAFMLWFWRPLRHTLVPVHWSWLIPVLAYLVAIAATVALARGTVRRFLVSLLVVNTMSNLLVLAYVVKGVDQVDAVNQYVAYFYWTAPIVLLLVVGLALADALPSLVSLPAGAAVAVAACVAFALAPATSSRALESPALDPSVPSVVKTVAARADDAWDGVVGFLVQAERANVAACVKDPAWTYIVTSQDICTPQQVATGADFVFTPTVQAPPGVVPIASLKGVIVTPGSTLLTPH